MGVRSFLIKFNNIDEIIRHVSILILIMFMIDTDIFAKYPEFYDTDCDNCINFANGEMYGLFNI